VVRAVVLVLLAAVLFGTTGTAQALGAPDVPALSLGAARIAIGGAVLALVAAVLARRSRATPGLSPRRRPATALTVLVGASGVVAYQPAFFVGTERLGVALGTLVALGSAPLATGILSWILDRRFPGTRWAAATAVAMVGLVLLAGVGGPSAGNGADALGLVSSLGAGLSYAVYSLMSKRLLDGGWTAPGAMGAVFGSAAMVSVVILAGTDSAWLATPRGASAALWLGLGTVTVAYLLFAAGLRSLPAASVSTLTLVEPLTAAVLGLVVLRETLSTTSWLGLAAIVLGIVILVMRPRRRRTRPGGARL
jgi:DME family drug/metabolite transporter